MGFGTKTKTMPFEVWHVANIGYLKLKLQKVFPLSVIT